MPYVWPAHPCSEPPPAAVCDQTGVEKPIVHTDIDLIQINGFLGSVGERHSHPQFATVLVRNFLGWLACCTKKSRTHIKACGFLA
jgi:hypothetical protein